jgi:spermidine synthase
LIVIFSSFASLTTELLQTHVLTIVWGGLITQLTLVFATYVFSLGMGALVYRENPIPETYFAWLQLLLALAGLITPVILLYAAYFLSPSLAATLAYTLVGIVGFLSGFELPLLNEIQEQNQFPGRAFENILFFDYLGMAIGSVIFSVILIRYLGFWKSLCLNGYLNIGLGIFVSLIFWRKISRSKRNLYWVISFLMLLLNSVLFANLDWLEKIATDWILG